MKQAVLSLTFFLLAGITPAFSSAAWPDLSNLLHASDTVSTDAKLVEKAMQVGIKEIAESEAAQTKVNDPNLREFATRMIAEHRKTNQELMTIAGAEGIPVPMEVLPEKPGVMNSVNEKAGEEFERRYVKTMIQDHFKAVKLFERAAKSAKNVMLKRFFEQKIGVLRSHLEQARKFNDSANK